MIAGCSSETLLLGLMAFAGIRYSSHWRQLFPGIAISPFSLTSFQYSYDSWETAPLSDQLQLSLCKYLWNILSHCPNMSYSLVLSSLFSFPLFLSTINFPLLSPQNIKNIFKYCSVPTDSANQIKALKKVISPHHIIISLVFLYGKFPGK